MFSSWKSLKAALHLFYFIFPNIAQLGVENVVPVPLKCCKQLNKGSFFKIKTNSKIHFKSASTCKTAPWHCTRELWWINWVHNRYCFSALALISCSKWLMEPQSRQCPQQILSKLTQTQSITLIKGSPHLEQKKCQSTNSFALCTSRFNYFSENHRKQISAVELLLASVYFFRLVSCNVSRCNLLILQRLLFLKIVCFKKDMVEAS